jgi:hypothetical protein
VLGYIEERSGTEFEPTAASAFVRMMRKVEGGIQLSPMAPENAGAEAAPSTNGDNASTANSAPAAAPPKPTTQA